MEQGIHLFTVVVGSIITADNNIKRADMVFFSIPNRGIIFIEPVTNIKGFRILRIKVTKKTQLSILTGILTNY